MRPSRLCRSNLILCYKSLGRCRCLTDSYLRSTLRKSSKSPQFLSAGGRYLLRPFLPLYLLRLSLLRFFSELI